MGSLKCPRCSAFSDIGTIQDNHIHQQTVEVRRKHVQDLEYIQFPVRQVHTRTRIFRTSEGLANIGLAKPRVFPLGAQAQLVSRTAAERLLEATQRIDSPIDRLLQLRNISGQPACSAIPSGLVKSAGSLAAVPFTPRTNSSVGQSVNSNASHTG